MVLANAKVVIILQYINLSNQNIVYLKPTSYMSNIKWGFPGGSALKNSLVMQKLQKTQGRSPGLGEFPRGHHYNPLQYSCLENPMDRGSWWAIQPMGSQRVVHDWNLASMQIYLNNNIFSFEKIIPLINLSKEK